MPAVTSGKALVTGANGYIAVWVVKTFLDQGFTVRGTVRSENKATHLRSLFKHFGDKFEVVIVEDITKEGAFDEAVKGIDAIAHTASPFHFKADDPNELIGPAVHGTTGILASVLKNAPTVKRIVVTSSCAAIRMMTPLHEPRLFTEADWNEASIVEVNEKGRAATNFGKYRASKTLAERAAWEFWNKHKDEVQWDLAVVNPPYVFGPFLHEVDKPEYLNESMRDWYETVVKGVRDDDLLVNVGSSYVDVRDLAQGHVLAVTKQEAGGERIIINAGLWKWQDFVNIAHRLCPSLPAGNASYDPATVVHLTSYSPDKERMLLGINFRTIEETTKDTLDDFKARGWL